MQQLLWLEMLLKLSAGLALLAIPGTTIKILGLPAAASGFWPRLLGAVLIGLAGALFIEGAWPGSRGLAIAGLIVVNLAAAATVAAAAVSGAGAPTRRGALVLWLAVAGLLLLVLFEIAFA
jgi:hypothetical protein